MLVLKRNYQFWFAVLGLHKLGAIAIPATDQLQKKDFEYRFEAAGVSAIICTAYGSSSEQAELAMETCPNVKIKIMTNGAKEGWHDFDNEYMMYRSTFKRTEDSAGGDDLMLMFFTSGTTGYPKMAAHSFKYPLGHFITAKYWHCVDPEGLHPVSYTHLDVYKRQGYYWYVGRVDDLIKSSGYRIGPFEIESVIMELPYVLELSLIHIYFPKRRIFHPF